MSRIFFYLIIYFFFFSDSNKKEFQCFHLINAAAPKIQNSQKWRIIL